MVDIRKIIIIFVIGILFSVFVFSIIEAVYPRPEYSDFCKEQYREKPTMATDSQCPVLDVPTADENSCKVDGGYIDFNRDSNGCAQSYYCEMCSKLYDDSNKGYQKTVFYISAILALIAIFIGLYLPAENNSLNEWIGTGFMLGGLFALFFGTMQSFRYLDRIVRPIVILLELILVIFMSYKKVGNLKADKKK